MNRRIEYLDRLEIVASQNIKEEQYWLKKLSGDLEKSIFPYDFEIEIERDLKEDLKIVNFQFTKDISLRLLKLSNKSDIRLFIVLAAGLLVLLHKYTGNGDIIVGMPLFKQDVEVDGEFINTVLALRNKFGNHTTFKELLLEVKDTAAEAAENQDYPFEILVEKLNLSTPADDFPLFDITILLENIQDEKDIQHIKQNLLFSFLRNGENIEGVLKYNLLRYKEETIERIANQYRLLLQNALLDLDASISSLNILSGEEKQRLLYDLNNLKSGYPAGMTIHRWFEEQVVKTPGVAALTFENKQLTYKELNEKSNQLARLLREHGVTRDSVVGILMNRSFELIIAVLAAAKAGGACLPIDTQYPEKRILTMLKDSEAAILLTRDNVLARLSFSSYINIKSTGINPVVTPPREQVTDFDKLPKPDRTLVKYHRFHKYIGNAMAKHTVSIQGTRGCPYNCTFCHKIWPKKHVVRSAEDIFAEIKNCYDAGARRFVFIDDIFNLDKKNSSRLFRRIIKQGLDVQLFFPNGLRTDLLDRDYIDLMVEAGTAGVALVLETASPRLQQLVKKNLNLKKFQENARYFCEKYPQVIVELFTMHGLPTETEEEVMTTLSFIQDLKWLHFPYIQILKIFPNTDMYEMALTSGISKEAIERSVHLAYHEIPETLPFPKSFTREYQSRVMSEYILSKKRLLHVFPYQMKILTEDELVQKYNSYLPVELKSFGDILRFTGISRQELGDAELLPPDHMAVPDFSRKMRKYFPAQKPDEDALRIFFLDLSQLFTSEKGDMLYDMVEPPLGMMYLLTYINKKFPGRVQGKIIKSRIDFDNYEDLKKLINEFKPDLIAVRTLSFFKDFFHRTVSLIKHWGFDVPIITGGPYATSDYQLMLEDSNIDLAVLGEGELTFARLVEKIMENGKKIPTEDVLRNIPGIAFMKNKDKQQLRKNRCNIIPVDKIPGELARYSSGNLEHINTPDDLFYVIYTSGSTGNPKGVMVEHKNMVNLIQHHHNHTNIDNTSVLQFSTICFDAFFHELCSTLLRGGKLSLIPEETRTDIAELFKVVERNKIKTLFLPMSFLKLLFKHEDYISLIPDCIKHIQTAGEKVVVSDRFKRYLKENHVYLHNHYGPSETHVVTTLTLDPSGEIPEYPSIGTPILNTDIYILDEEEHLLPWGATGELCVGGLQVGRGYFKKPGLTAKKFLKNPFVRGDSEMLYKTGDLARWLWNGNIELLGRLDHQVKIRGFRVEPEEVKNQLLNIEFIKEAVVIVREDEPGEKYLCAYFVSGKEVDSSNLKDILSDNLPNYMVPPYFVQLEKIPLSLNGKVDRNALPKPRIDKKEKNFIAPKGELEVKLAEIWSEVLGMERYLIGVNSDFFQLGGHSLLAINLITRIHKAFNVKMTLGILFKSPTIKGLAGYIKGMKTDIFTSIKAVEKREYYALSSPQKRLYILQQMDLESTGYNIPGAFVLKEEAGKKELETVFRKLIKRHESLRTSFEAVGGEIVQRIYDDADFELGYCEADEQSAGKTIDDFVRPFDPGIPPLFRAGVIRVEGKKSLLLIDMHHIITDGASMRILEKEFIRRMQGRELPPLRLQYKDYSEWTRGKEKSIKKQQERYWLKEFEGETPVLVLPTDYPRPGVQRFEGGWLHFGIGPGETQALKKLAAGEGATLYMVLLAIYNILLSKLSNREIIIVGTPVAGRRHADLEPIIGMFVNTLAIKNHPTGEKSFTQFLKEVKGKTLEAFDNQDYQFEDLVEMVGGERDRSRNPIFDVMFEMLNAELETGEFSKEIMGEHKEKHLYQNKMSKFDMTLVVVDTGKPLSFTVKFNTKLFKRETMERFIETFKQIMGKVIENNKIKLAEIDVLSELRRDELEARLSDDLEMDTSIEYNLYLADSQDGVDKLNKKFYERFNYPWFPGMLPSFEDSNFWITFLNQDIGDWKNSRIPPQPKIWVAGCGTNQAILTALKFPDAEILGTDISTKSIEICQNIAQQIGLKNLELREQSINKVRYKDTFDYIICTGVIHHNADPGIPLKNLSGALKKNGIMELMVYNYYHRIVTTAFQKAIRALCSKGSSIDMDMDIELPIAKAMIDNFFLQNYMGKFLAAKKGSPEVAIADSFLQPVEHSYTIESLDELAKCCNLQILTHCINQFDKKSGSLTWNINFNNKKIRDFYNPLPDIKRWQVSNLLMFEKSPMLWFYLQREDSENRRKTEKDICDTFLETSFKKVETSCKHYVLSPQKTYLLNPREFPCPAPPVPVDPVSKIVFDAVNSKSTMRAIFSNLNIETSFHTVNTIRLNLTTTAFPYLKAMT